MKKKHLRQQIDELQKIISCEGIYTNVYLDKFYK